MNVCNVYKLTVCSFMMGCVSVALLALAVSTDSWLLTREFLLTPGEDGSMGNATDYKTWLRVWTGLWRFCMMDENLPDEVYCMAVNYDVSNTGRGEAGAITTTTIISAARGAVALPASALLLSIIAVIFVAVGNIRQDMKTLIGGVLFVLAGLSLAVGMILYISAINDEVGYRSSTSKEEGGFSYAYGWSFYTAGFGFLTSELSAVVTLTLYLRRNENVEDMARIIPGLEDKMAAQGSSGDARHQQIMMKCHGDNESEVFTGGGCCSLTCWPEEFNRKDSRLPWYGACARGACGGQRSAGSDGASDSSSSSRAGKRRRSLSASV
ncbi:hypothetical protein PoB_003465300 [Plakobranchus ocellatus]|uniref:Uncharacterized protein n=1 Tax=Plakobranchus ocellatus TaxID=259542 RepID=A0AAV4AMX7_9GAST|nr:hypothetical protein PoB_003465300 [Plakobranchus ocellatus]